MKEMYAMNISNEASIKHCMRGCVCKKMYAVNILSASYVCSGVISYASVCMYMCVANMQELASDWMNLMIRGVDYYLKESDTCMWPYAYYIGVRKIN